MKCPPFYVLWLLNLTPAETDQFVLRMRNLTSEDFAATGKENFGSKFFLLS